MIKVLTITSILPIAAISHKKNENNILLVIENKLIEKYADIRIEYLFIVPDTNKLLTYLSSKWKAYYQLIKSKQYSLENKKIHIFGVIQLPKVLSHRNVLYELSFIRNKKKIKKIIYEYQPTIIHAQNTDVDAYFARRIKEVFNIPYVVTLRGLNVVADKHIISNLEGAKKLMALSPTQKRDAQKLTKKEILVIPHGIPDEFFVDDIPEKNYKELRLISVCRLLKLKNLNLVIEALSSFRGEFLYDIYGEGPEMENLKTLIHHHSLSHKIKLKGHINHKQLPEILKNYELFVMPSFPESLGRVYFEAMASGLPILATKNTGIDGLIEDGKEGFLVESNNINELIEVIESVSENKKKLVEMGFNAKVFSSNYKWKNIISKTYRFYLDK